MCFLYQKICNPQKFSKACSVEVEWIVLCKILLKFFQMFDRCCFDPTCPLSKNDSPDWKWITSWNFFTWLDLPHTKTSHMFRNVMTHGKLNKTTLPSELPSPNIATCSKMVLERTFSLHYIYIRWFQTSISDAETKHDIYIYTQTKKHLLGGWLYLKYSM